jgi:hypothetical protein
MRFATLCALRVFAVHPAVGDSRSNQGGERVPSNSPRRRICRFIPQCIKVVLLVEPLVRGQPSLGQRPTNSMARSCVVISVGSLTLLVT